MPNIAIQNKEAKRSKISTKRINLPARSSFFFTLTGILSKGAALIFTPIFTRLLSAEEYGEYSLFSTVLSLSTVAVTMEISSGVIMRLYQKERERQFLSILSAWLISLKLAVLCTLCLVILSSLTDFSISFPAAYLFLFLSLISISMINLYVSRCRFLYRWGAPLLISLLQSILSPMLAIILIRSGVFSALSNASIKVGCSSAVLFITALILTFGSLKVSRFEIKKSTMKRSDIRIHIKESERFLLKLAAPLLPYYLSVIAIFQTDKLIVSSAFGKGALAGYSIAWSAGTAISAVTGGIMSVFSPWLMRRARASEYGKIKNALDVIITSAVPFVILFLCIAPEVFSFLAPSEYKNALPITFISAIPPIPLAIAQCASSIAIAKEKVRGVLLSGLIPAALSLVLNLALFKIATPTAISVITAISATLLVSISVFNVRKITSNNIINVNKAFQMLLILSIFSALIYVFRSLVAVRICIGILSLVAALFSSRRLLPLLKERRADSRE